MQRIAAVRRWALTPPRAMDGLLWIAGPLIAATAARAAMTPILGATLVYAAYYPAALLTTLRLGPWGGGAVIVLGGAVANILFVDPPFRATLNARDAAGLGLYALAAGMIVWTATWLRIAIRQLEGSLAREAELNAELQHRVKNTMAVVQGLAVQTARTQAGLGGFMASFEGRLVALGKAHNVLETGRWEVADLPLLAEAALEAFPRERLTLDGPVAHVAKASCTPLVLALHELATNAVKHGAWSVGDGRVMLSWRQAGDRILLEWRETDGPPVTPPERRGLGSRLLGSQPGALSADLRFEPDGVVCDMAVPAATRG